jgi:DNA-binding response OmpR family regulator
MSSRKSYKDVMRQKIMVIEDDLDTRLAIECVLENAGYEVSLFDNAHDAMEQVQHEPPALILMDVMMPNMDGFAATKALKSNVRTAAVPIVMLTALGEIEDMENGWDSGVDLYLQKPFHPQQFLDYVQTILAPTTD